MRQNSFIFTLLLVISCSVVINPGFSFSEEIRYQSGDRRDPFVPVKSVSVAAAVSQDMNIEGIIYDRDGASVVVIRGEAYKKGDSLGDQKIVAIYSSRITVQGKDGKQNDFWISESESQLSSS